MANKKKGSEKLIVKRYGNRRLYNTETSTYVNYQNLVELIREGRDMQVIDSRTKEDVTKAILIQIILEEEKNKKSMLPVEFLFQLVRSREETAQDFFRNYLSTSFEAYMRTKQEFDRRFKGWLEMSATAPQMLEKLFPGAEAMKDLWGLGKKEEEPEEEPKEGKKKKKKI